MESRARTHEEVTGTCVEAEEGLRWRKRLWKRTEPKSERGGDESGERAGEKGKGMERRGEEGRGEMEMGEERRGDLSRCGWDAGGTRK